MAEVIIQNGASVCGAKSKWLDQSVLPWVTTYYEV